MRQKSLSPCPRFPRLQLVNFSYTLRQKFLSSLARVSYITPGQFFPIPWDKSFCPPWPGFPTLHLVIFFLYLETEVSVLPGQGFLNFITAGHIFPLPWDRSFCPPWPGFPILQLINFFPYLETEVFVLPGQGLHGSGGTLEGALDLHHLHHSLESKKLKISIIWSIHYTLKNLFRYSKASLIIYRINSN